MYTLKIKIPFLKERLPRTATEEALEYIRAHEIKPGTIVVFKGKEWLPENFMIVEKISDNTWDTGSLLFYGLSKCLPQAVIPVADFSKNEEGKILFKWRVK